MDTLLWKEYLKGTKQHTGNKLVQGAVALKAYWQVVPAPSTRSNNNVCQCFLSERVEKVI